MAFGSMKNALDDFNSKYQLGQKASSAFQGVKSATVKGSKHVANAVTKKKGDKASSEKPALPDDSVWEHAERHAAKPLESRTQNGARAPLSEVRSASYDNYTGGGADIWDHAKTNSFKTREEEKRAAAAFKAKPRGVFDTSADESYTFHQPEPEKYKVFLPGYIGKSSYEKANERARPTAPVRSNSNPFDEPWQ